MPLATLSFDDGDNRDASLAALLRREGVPATFYLLAARYAGWRADVIVPNIAAYADMEIGCHAWAHWHLDRLDPANYSAHTYAARQALINCFAQPVVCYAYPYGVTTDGFVKSAIGAGFRFGRTYHIDPADASHPRDPWRISVSAHCLLPQIERISELASAGLNIHIAGHSWEMTPETDRVLLRAVEALRKAGYRFVPNGIYFQSVLEGYHASNFEL